VVSPVGFDLADFPVQAARPYRRENRLNVLSIGRLSPEKGFRYAVEGVRQLLERGHRDLHYRVVGGGPMLDELREQVASAGLAEWIELVGPLPRAGLLEEMRLADVLVLPSIVVGTWEENQACVAQEAMLSQALVIASTSGGIPESLAPAHHAYMVPEGDATAIAAQLARAAALTVDELRALGDAGRTFAVERYDIRSLNRQIIDETLRRGGAAGGRAA
jgi:colanic acid/amylovoran biosynthesis glycosyltransferase